MSNMDIIRKNGLSLYCTFAAVIVLFPFLGIGTIFLGIPFDPLLWWGCDDKTLCEGIHSVLLLIAFVLIASNTYQYLWKDRKEPHSDRAWQLILLCLVLTSLIIVKIFASGIRSLIGGLLIELTVFIIFVVFLCVDYHNWNLARKRGSNVEKEKLALEFDLNQALFVDLPVVLGMFFSFALAYIFSLRFVDLQQYLLGFFSGATAMHLTISQIIYLILACKKDYQYEKLER